jgi:CDP-4-dehydro-6-deoxyglucose reductase/ferredoxin-NAD(P)+ reductase (naphthalene dioxygenase ferredoxin-specific)
VQSLGRTVTVAPEATILDALVEEGVEYPHGCTTGLCGLCKSRLIAGRVDLLDHYESALSDTEQDAGLTLPCRAMPLTDCVITPVQHDAMLPIVRTFDTEIVELRELTHDIRLVRLRIPDDLRFEFLPGQYATLAFGSAPPRDFSMASRPGDSTLDFFIRRVAQGLVTDLVFRSARVGDRVRVKGPFGLAYLREAHIGPMLAVAGGSGLAPIWSIVATALERGMLQAMRVIVGVRTEQDVYLEDALASLAARHPNLSVDIALSDAAAPTSRRRGYLHEIIEQDLRGHDLAKWQAYVAGPPVMVDAVERVLKALGLPRGSCHVDPFLTAADRNARSGVSMAR